MELSKSIKSQINSCGEIPSFGNGANILIQQNGNSPFYGSAYIIKAAVHAFPIDTRKHGTFVCADIDGVVKKTAVKASHCFNIQDQKPGEPARSDFRACYGLPAGPYTGFIVIRHGLGYFHDQSQIDRVNDVVLPALSQNVTVYLPNSNGSC